MRLAVFGSTAVGSIIGAYITKYGHPIDIIDKNVHYIQTIQEKGIKVFGVENFKIHVSAFLASQMTSKYDVIFLASSRKHNIETVNFLLDSIEENSIICTFQEGDPDEEVSSIIGESRTVGCAALLGCDQVETGVYRLNTTKKDVIFYLGPVRNQPRLSTVKYILELISPVVLVDEIRGARWSRLLLTSTFSGLSACLGVNLGNLISDPDVKIVLQLLGWEVIKCVDASEVKLISLRKNFYICFFFTINSKLRRFLNSLCINFFMRDFQSVKGVMMGELQKESYTEVDFINGLVSETAKKIGFETPFQDRLIRIVHEIEEKKRKPDLANVALFSDLVKNYQQKEPLFSLFQLLFIIIVIILIVIFFQVFKSA